MDRKEIVTIEISNVVDDNNNNNEFINNNEKEIRSNFICECIFNIFHIIWCSLRNCVNYFCTQSENEGNPKLMRANCVRRKKRNNI